MNNRYATVALIATILILGFTTIAGAFLIPNTALAKKSKHNSDDDGTSSSSSSPSTPGRSIIGQAGDGYDAGKAAGASAERSGQTYDAECPSGHTDAWCISYHAGYQVGWSAAKIAG